MKRAGPVLMIFLMATLPVCAAEATPEAQIRELLASQMAAWNRGDLEGFMNAYRKSPNTVFVRSRGVSRGWQEVFDAYHRAYPARAAMGKASFNQLEVTMLAPDAAVVLARWRLQRAEGTVGGVFTLVLRKFPEGWRIILDHTSAMDPPPSD